MREATYSIAPRGLATSYTESELPIEFSSKFRNRFTNAVGGAEKRQGIAQLGETVPGTPTITGIHEYVSKTGDTTLFVSGAGSIFEYDGLRYTSVYSGLDATARLRSIQFGDKLIFSNGVDRDFFFSTTSPNVSQPTYGPNLVNGTPTLTASSTGAGDVGNLDDGDNATTWAANGGTSNWCKIQFSTARTITRVRFYITNTSGLSTGGVIEGSNDDSSWTELATFDATFTELGNTFGWLEKEFSNQTAFTYIRVTFTFSSSSQNTLSLLEAYEYATPKETTYFTELKPIIETGISTTGTDTTTIADSDVTDWVGGTDVVINDIVYNTTLDAYGVITAVTTASVAHTEIGPSSTGIGYAASAQSVGDGYEILDLVELNIVPTDVDDDNTAVASVGTTVASVVVSAVSDWTETEIRVGDFIRNTTQAAVTQVTAISTAALGVVGVSGQTSGDSLVFLKSAMPISKRIHAHYGRLYHIDARDQRKIRISGANDAQDMTTDAGTLDAITFNFGDLQPQGDTVITLGSFQRFLVLNGKKNIYAYSGTVPYGDSADFTPVGLFPHGTISADGAESLGNEYVFVTNDGLQSFALIDDSSTLNRSNLSDPLRATLRDELKNAAESEIQVLHYPRRSWLLLKVGSLLYCFNYTTKIRDRNANVSNEAGSWSLFDGKFAQQEVYFVRRSGDLICAGAGGKVYSFDQGVYSDDGNSIPTEYRTGWLSLEEPKRTVRHKRGVYIKPILDAGAAITYTVMVEAGFDSESTDSVTISTSGNAAPIGLAVIGTDAIGGSSIINEKHPLRWKGEVARVTIENDNTSGPDVIGRFTLYANLYGRK